MGTLSEKYINIRRGETDMFGTEFASKKKHHKFPEYNISQAVSVNEVEKISPLLWQEHCIECSMPACYSSCVNYRRRVDGRCRLFKFGIERFANKNAILGQNVVIDIDKWGKLETLYFTSGFSYNKLKKINCFVNWLGMTAQTLRWGKVRRLCYYIREYFTREIGNSNEDIPQFFLCEIVNSEEKPYILHLEGRANDKIVYKTNLVVKEGFNRFWIPTEEFHLEPEEFDFTSMQTNSIYLYPEGNNGQRINFVSLEILTLKPRYIDKYFPPSTKKVKCIVWDLDNTVWDGIIGEEGIDGIKIREDIVSIIKKMDARGILNSISSKNYEEKAVEALKKFNLFDFFVSPMINWNAKSNSIKLIAKALDISMDTFVFVDDSNFELNEVKQNCPGIRTCNVKDILKYVEQDIFCVPVTEDGKKRRESYKEIAIRNKAALEYKNNITEFLRDCDIIVRVEHPVSSELMRCFELTQRTNQLNISGERLTLEQIKDMVESSNYDCFRIKVHDKFGDYGLVGFAIFDVSEKDMVMLKHFVFSCRAARKKIEQSFFEYVIDIYRERGFKKLGICCRITEKNYLMRQVLCESELFVKKEIDKDSYILEHEMDNVLKKMDIMTIIRE